MFLSMPENRHFPIGEPLALSTETSAGEFRSLRMRANIIYIFRASAVHFSRDNTATLYFAVRQQIFLLWLASEIYAGRLTTRLFRFRHAMMPASARPLPGFLVFFHFHGARPDTARLRFREPLLLGTHHSAIISRISADAQAQRRYIAATT